LDKRFGQVDHGKEEQERGLRLRSLKKDREIITNDFERCIELHDRIWNDIFT